MKIILGKASSRRAMSILELLLVVGLVTIMATLAVPAFVSIAQGSGMRRAIVGVSDALEQARTEAMATSTWVLVGFSQDTTAVPSTLTVVTVASRDGTSDTSAANLIQLFRPLKIENVKLLERSTGWASNATLLNNSMFSFTGTVAGKPKSFSNTVIAFSPQGEALIQTSALSSWIEIPLCELRGSKEIEEKMASIRVSGPSGQVVVSY